MKADLSALLAGLVAIASLATSAASSADVPGQVLPGAVAATEGQAPPATIDATPEATPEQILARAFENLYDVATTATIELLIRDSNGRERRRSLASATKVIDGRQHSIGRLVAPEHLRGMTMLQIEGVDRSHDAFVYMPSMRAVRRVSTAQRGDAVFGSDVTYEDLERRRIEDYRVTGVSEGVVQGEPVLHIRARPRRDRSFDSILFDIARTDGAMLGASYFKRGELEPFRRISAVRSEMRAGSGHTLPTRLFVKNRNRRTTTEVVYLRLEIEPIIDDRLFSVRTLEQRGRIPGAAGRR